MKATPLTLLLADDQDQLLQTLAEAIAKRDGVQARRDRQLPLVRVGKTTIVLLPARGTAAPAPETAKPVNAKQIPWCPENVVWIARDEMRKRKFEGSDRAPFTQTVKVELMTILAQTERIVVVRLHRGAHPADDLLVFDLPDLAVEDVVLSNAMSGQEMLEMLNAATGYRRSKPRAEMVRFRSEIDYVLSTNLNVGISARLKAMKVGPMRGVHCTFVQLGLLAAFGPQPNRERGVRWDVDVVIERETNEFLGAELYPPATTGTSYATLVAGRPREGGVATVARLDRGVVVKAPPGPLTLGELMNVALACGDDALARLPDALRFLGRQRVITSDSKVAPTTPHAAALTAQAFVDCGLGGSAVEALLARLRAHALLELQPSAGPTPVALDDATRLVRLDRTPLYDALLRAIADRWARRLLGPFQADRVDVVFSTSGNAYRSVRYDNVTAMGWCVDATIPMLPRGIRVGERWTVAQTRIEPGLSETAEDDMGRRFDLLTTERIVNDPWSGLRLPNGTLGNAYSTLDALCRLIDDRYIDVRSGRISLGTLGRQVLASVPVMAQHPIWAINARSAARRANTPAYRHLVRHDFYAVLRGLRASIDGAPILVSKSLWTKEPKPGAPATGTAGGRVDARDAVERPEPSDREKARA